MIEIAIKVSDSSQTLRVKHILYNQLITADQADPILKDLVEAAIKSFKGNAEDVFVTIKFSW